MTAADKLRELLASRPAHPNLEELVRWWRASVELMPRMLNELADVEIAVDAYKTAFEPAFDEIAKLCGCPQWDYPGQLIRDVQNVVQERDNLRGDLDDARAKLRREQDARAELRLELDREIAERKRQSAAVDVLKQEVRELEQQRDQLIAYVDDAKRAAGSERVGGEPLADFITRLVDDQHRLRADVERTRVALAQRERMEAGHV